METRFVPDAPGAWLVYDLGGLVLALPAEYRAAADAVAASPPSGLSGVLEALRASGIAGGAPFALIDGTPDGVHLALRGPATVAAESETLTGLGSESWLERLLPGVTVVRLTVPGGEWTFALGAARAALSPAVGPSVPIAATPAPAPAVAGPPRLLDAPPEATAVPDADDEPPARPPILAPPAPAPAPAPGPALSLELPDGSRHPLDAVVLVGRAPVLPAGATARLLRLSDGDISRSHARVAVEGDTAVVTDLGSRNGTVVRIPGRPAQRLRGHEPTPVLPDTVIDFGGGVELRVREG